MVSLLPLHLKIVVFNFFYKSNCTIYSNFDYLFLKSEDTVLENRTYKCEPSGTDPEPTWHQH